MWMDVPPFQRLSIGLIGVLCVEKGMTMKMPEIIHVKGVCVERVIARPAPTMNASRLLRPIVHNAMGGFMDQRVWKSTRRRNNVTLLNIASNVKPNIKSLKANLIVVFTPPVQAVKNM